MNRVGIGIDLSHVGRETIKDVLEFTEKPVFFTHAGSYSVCETPRNFRDDELKAIADTGGLIGINSLAAFLSKKPGPDVTIDDWLDHVDHVFKVVGADHIGFGTDLTENSKASDYPVHKDTLVAPWPWDYPVGLQTVSEFPNITRGLVSRGYSDDDIEKILGGNFLRVFEEIVG
jgi:membrane dipeptidase